MRIASVAPLTRLPWPGKFFDYLVPGELADLQRGDVAEVEFAHRRINAVIWGISDNSTLPIEKLRTVLGRTPSPYRLTEQQMGLAQWMSEGSLSSKATILLGIVPSLPRRNVEPTPWPVTLIDRSQKPSDRTFARTATDVDRLALYRQLAAKNIAARHQLLLLCPDQSSADEIADALKDSAVQLWHWRADLNVTEQYRVHREIASGTPGLVVGTKSALLLPYRNLDAVIVDQAGSDWHYQWDARPRYDARAAAAELARLHGSQLLLCGALPTVEQWQGVKNGSVRQMQIPPPPLSEGGRTNAQRSKITVHYLSQGQRGLIDPRVEQQIRETLDRQGAVYVYCSRSGNGLLRCQDCGLAVRCPSCGQAAQLGDDAATLRCEHCQWSADAAPACQRCHSVRLKASGWGVARVAKELERMFGVPVDLWDRLSLKQDTRPVLSRAEGYGIRDARIAVGTSLLLAHRPLTRWSLFVVLRADDDLLRSEYRAAEEFAQLIMTVSGAGVPVAIQADQEHPLLSALGSGQVAQWLDAELENRQRFSYPPAVQLWRWSCRTMEQAVELRTSLAKALTPEFQIGEPYSASQASVKKNAGHYLLVKAPVGMQLPTDHLTDKLFSQVVLESDPPRLFS